MNPRVSLGNAITVLGVLDTGHARPPPYIPTPNREYRSIPYSSIDLSGIDLHTAVYTNHYYILYCKFGITLNTTVL